MVEEEIENQPEVKEDGIIDMFYYQTKKRLFMEIYNIDWIPYGATLNDNFIEEYQKILDKYNLKCDVLASFF